MRVRLCRAQRPCGASRRRAPAWPFPRSVVAGKCVLMQCGLLQAYIRLGIPPEGGNRTMHAVTAPIDHDPAPPKVSHAWRNPDLYIVCTGFLIVNGLLFAALGVR